MNPNYQKWVKMFYCNAFALRRMCDSLQCSAMDLHAYMQTRQISHGIT